MSYKVSLHDTINAALAASRPKPAPKPTSVARMRHNLEAEKVIRDTLEGWGMGGCGITAFLAQPTLARGKLAADPTGKLSAEGRQVTRMLVALRGNRHASGDQKLRFAARYAAMKPGRGARQVLDSLAQTPAFWKTLQKAHRDIIYYQLRRAPSQAASRKLGKAYATLLGDRLFLGAGAQGKKNALSQPDRAVRLLSWHNRSKVRLPVDEATRQREAWSYASRHSGRKTATGRRQLYHAMVAQSGRTVSRFFDNLPTYKATANKSVWYGEAYMKHNAFSWEQTTEEYLKVRREQERCGLFNGRGKDCLR